MRYAVIVDAGSSGSRVFVYSWQDPGKMLEQMPSDSPLRSSLVAVEAQKHGILKIPKGISNFAGNISQIWPEHLSLLVDRATELVPAESQHETPFFFLATAGIRLLPKTDQDEILSEVCSSLQKKTKFYVPECSSHVNVIDGQIEGLYGWLSLNYLVNWDMPDDMNNYQDTYGFLDMGGASAQLAFVPEGETAERHKDDLHKVALRTLEGKSLEWNVFVTTWLGFGANQAQTRLRDRLVKGISDELLEPAKHGSPVAVHDPCLQPGMRDFQWLTHPRNDHEEKIEFLFDGTGSFDECSSLIEDLLNKGLPCNDQPCLFDGVHVPDFDLPNQKFVGVSEFWYTAQDLFGTNGKFELGSLLPKVKEFCESDWETVNDNYSKIKDVRKACFKSTWVLNVLNKGFEFSLETQDPNSPHNFRDSFQSAVDIRGTEISWTLGRAVLYASSQTMGSSDVGIQKYGTEFVPGGEVANAPLPRASANRSFAFLSLIIVLLLAVILRLLYKLYPGMRGWIPLTRDSAGSEHAEDGLPTHEYPLDEYRSAVSTTLPSAKVPSRVGSRLNLRGESDWD